MKALLIERKRRSLLALNFIGGVAASVVIGAGLLFWGLT